MKLPIPPRNKHKAGTILHERLLARVESVIAIHSNSIPNCHPLPSGKWLPELYPDLLLAPSQTID
jgi:hypothetical protein